MAIVFSCEHCGKNIKTDESKAGKRVKCPGCSEVITIPQPDVEDADEEEEEEEFETIPSRGAKGKSSKTRCKMCGESVAPTDKTCPACGEKLTGKKSRPLASLGQRFTGALIDGLFPVILGIPGFALLVLGLPAQPDGPNGAEPSPIFYIGMLLLGVTSLACLIVQIYLMAKRSQTIGKLYAKTKVFDFETHQPATFFQIFLMRLFVNQLIGGLPCVGPIYGLADVLYIFSEDRRCLHDKLAGTYVVDISED